MKRVLLAMALASMTLSGAALAKDHGKGEHGKSHASRGHDHHGEWRRDRDDDRHDWRDEGRHDNGRHLGQIKHHWARGERLPRTYLVPQYYVRDYRAYDLAPPPAGNVWVQPYQDSRQFYLVQMATGLINQIFGY